MVDKWLFGMTKTKRTNTAMVIYDGECAFCRQAVSAIRARDKQAEFMYVSRHTPGIEEQFPQVDFGDFDKGMVLVEPHGSVHVGADAIHFIVSRLPYFRLFCLDVPSPMI
jgi:predicted DCC family thiol-disulfide oxidoreductase YuxK